MPKPSSAAKVAAVIFLSVILHYAVILLLESLVINLAGPDFVVRHGDEWVLMAPQNNASTPMVLK